AESYPCACPSPSQSEAYWRISNPQSHLKASSSSRWTQGSPSSLLRRLHGGSSHPPSSPRSLVPRCHPGRTYRWLRKRQAERPVYSRGLSGWSRARRRPVRLWMRFSVSLIVKLAWRKAVTRVHLDGQRNMGICLFGLAAWLDPNRNRWEGRGQ
ncbi:hypothetical protein LZ30DRAFT_814912, partial [Colletotrichum cereale]